MEIVGKTGSEDSAETVTDPVGGPKDPDRGSQHDIQNRLHFD